MQNLAFADRVWIPSVVAGELIYGFMNGGSGRKNRAFFEEFLREPQVEIATVSLRTAQIYAELALYLKRQGTPIPTNDLWIAAQTHEVGGELATRDRHFDTLSMVKLAREMS